MNPYQQQTGKTPMVIPTQPPEDSILTEITKQARLVTRLYDRVFRDEGCDLHSTQYELLRSIWKHSAGEDLGRMSKKLGLDRCTLSRRLMPLIEKNLIRYERPLRDHKSCIPTLTEQGMAVIMQFSGTYNKTAKWIKNNLPRLFVEDIEDLEVTAN